MHPPVCPGLAGSGAHTAGTEAAQGPTLTGSVQGPLFKAVSPLRSVISTFKWHSHICSLQKTYKMCMSKNEKREITHIAVETHTHTHTLYNPARFFLPLNTFIYFFKIMRPC